MKLHFRKTGTGKPIVILHGLLGSSDNWQTFSKQLASFGYTVYMVDLRNHGLSPHDKKFNYTVLAADIAELFEMEHLETAHIMGHSLGGKTAMTFAYTHPELVSSLIVIDIAPRQYPVQHRNILDALLDVDLKKNKSRKEVEIHLTAALNDPIVIQFLLKNLYWKEKEHLGWRFNLPVINENIANVGTATLPPSTFENHTLFVKGERSNYITYDDEREILEQFANVEIKTAPGAGHWVHADNAGWLVETVNAFLSDK
ncbi:MAG: alpha/beta fold hydrolase [Saprospiraceae bacterium]